MSKSSNPPTMSDLLARGKAHLFAREIDQAIVALTDSVEAEPHAALALAYRSMAWRLKQDKRKALNDAQAALRREPDCLEGRVAHCLALVTDGTPDSDDLNRVTDFYTKFLTHPAREVDGDCLTLGVVLLLRSFILDIVNNKPGEPVYLLRTYLSKGAWLFLEGKYAQAYEAFWYSYERDHEVRGALGMALAMFRLGEPPGDIREMLVLFFSHKPKLYTVEQTAIDRLRDTADRLPKNP